MILSRRALLEAGAFTLTAASAPGAAAARSRPEWAPAVATAPGDLAPRPLRLVRGRPPADLAGVLYRNGPARFSRGDAPCHWFDGDGMVRAFRIGPNGASLAARFVDTAKSRSEAAAGAMTMGGFAPGAPGAAVRGTGDVNAANTAVLAAGGRLWALWEGGSPTAIDPDSLETLGPVTLREDLRDVPFLAHPRVEPDGRIWNLGLAGEKGVIWRLSAEGGLEAAAPFRLPRASYVHDFTATDRELIVVLQPWLRERAGRALTDSLVWRPEAGTQVLVIDKDDLAVRGLYELPALFFFHLGDAWRDKTGAVVFDGCFRQDIRHAEHDIAQITAAQPFQASPTRSALVTLRPDGRAEIAWTGAAAEFPVIDRRRAGRPRRYTWHTTGDARPLSRSLALRDWRSGRLQTCDFGGGHVVEEAAFVPGPGAGEGEGWLVVPTLNLRRQASELHVFDALRIGEGPICTWRADVALPIGFHGTFVSS